MPSVKNRGFRRACRGFVAFCWGKSCAYSGQNTREPAGISFLIMLLEEEIMFGALTVVFKNLIKSSLDNYVLPGTLTGTEILWLYMVQWKRDLIVLASVTYSHFIAQCELPTLERVISQYKGGSRSAD